MLHLGMHERRKRARQGTTARMPVSVTYVDDSGRYSKLSGAVVNQSESGSGLVLGCALDVGSFLRIEMPENAHGNSVMRSRDVFVRWCKGQEDGDFLLGVVHADTCASNAGLADTFDEDLYEVLQVSTNADLETIHRIFRILATRYHPDNRETGDAAAFHKLVDAYNVLSDPSRRAAFDVWYRQNCKRQWKIFESSTATSGITGEKRKRAGILQALYTKRIADPDKPMLNSRELENLLGCPREHLEFALWYLREGGHVARTDNGKFQITVKGVDLAETLVEESSIRVPLQITAASEA